MHVKKTLQSSDSLLRTECRNFIPDPNDFCHSRSLFEYSIGKDFGFSVLEAKLIFGLTKQLSHEDIVVLIYLLGSNRNIFHFWV